MSTRDLINELKADRDDLEQRLERSERTAQQAANLMYRRGYLAGHTAGRKGVASLRGPYRTKDPA